MAGASAALPRAADRRRPSDRVQWRCSAGPSVSRSTAPSASAIRHSSYAPSIGAREHDRLGRPGHGDSRGGSPTRDVAAHARAGHEVVPRREVPAARRVRLRPVGREQPDVVAAAAAPLELVAERRDRPRRPAARPGRRTRTGVRRVTAVDRRVATSTTWIAGRRRGRGRGRRSETNAIRVPSGDQAGSRSETGPSVSRVAAPVATSTSHRWRTWSYWNPGPLSMYPSRSMNR